MDNATWARWEQARIRYGDDMTSICHEMLGTAGYFDEHPDYGTAEVRAETFDRFAAQIRERDAAWQVEREAILGKVTA